MPRVLRLMLWADLAGSFTMQICQLLGLVGGWGLAGLLSLGLLLVPTLLGVGLYELIRPATLRPGPVQTVLLRASLLAGLFVLGLWAWAAAESAPSWAAIRADFKREFTPFLPAALVEALLIPVFDQRLGRRTD
ncbi:hypothetical protein LJ737_13595 [Hymenobacter sp. 15J16-1T3B]|uniref:hypothetical protein n=1 Tax=Hymenobacter sp. 15J16-1T3B TaxID=2886941 RepID=UPI001D1182CC|nr:hypothetical protein [Hymenobacter sp. 15J16-1T3B]MCC3158277.1 hypothetical protein [Hymenobacter sp. 15J16-1T3B]